MNKHIIWNLMLRDGLAYKKHIVGISLISLIMGMLMIFVNTNLSRMFASGASIVFITIIVPFISELKNKSIWQHTASLPVTRKAMVTARFLISLAILAINIIMWVVAFEVLFSLLNADPKYAINGSIIVMVSMSLVLNLAVFYLIYFRFNFFTALGIYLFLMIVPSLIQVALSATYGVFIENFNKPVPISIISIGILCLSYFSSANHFSKRDI